MATLADRIKYGELQTSLEAIRELDYLISDNHRKDARIAELEAALREIASGRIGGKYSSDRLTHCENTLEAHREYAARALLEGGK